MMHTLHFEAVRKMATQSVHLNRPNGLFRQSLNGTGNGNWNFVNTNGFLDIMLSFHTVIGLGLELDGDRELREWVSDPILQLTW